MSVSTVRGRIARQLGFRLFAIASTQPIVAAASDVKLATNAKKAPNTGYQVFQQDPKVKEKLGTSTGKVSEISKKLSAEWNSLSDSEKQKYKDRQQQLAEEFVANGGAPKKTPKPKGEKKAPNGYSKFVTAKYQEVKSQLPDKSKSTEVFKELGKIWSGLSQAEKEKY